MSRAPQVKPLTLKQKELVQKAWALGYNDKLIAAHPKINAEYLAVHRFRHEMGINTKTISENRYDTWMRAILSAGNVEPIIEKLGESYGVTPYQCRWKCDRQGSCNQCNYCKNRRNSNCQFKSNAWCTHVRFCCSQWICHH